MKKKLEAELISIAHRILKMKNRSELDQLQAETLKLYEKLSVLKFVEDNFADVKPTIGYASAEGKLEDIYGIEEVPEVHANEVEAAEDKARAEKKSLPAPEGGDKEKKHSDDKQQDKESENGEGVTAGKEEAPVAEEEKAATETPAEEAKPEGDADPDQKVEEYQASEEEKEHTEEETDEEVKEEQPQPDKKPETVEEPAKEEAPEVKEPDTNKEEDKKEEVAEEPEQKIEVVKPEEEVKAMEQGAAAVFEKEDNSTEKEEENAIDAEVVTITPDASAKTQDSGLGFEFAFERKPAPEEPQKQKEISFEDYHDYKEPEFVKKDDKREEAQTEKAEEKKEEPKAEADDWRNWEPKRDAQPETPKEEPKREQPTQDFRPKASDLPATSRPLNETFGRTITLGLNDRIAFEKHLFGGSSEDLNRVVSQINTQNSFDEAKAFIEDLVKPDYNNWKGKEEYEERFMALIEKKFE